jgi:hypothetical protein
VDGVRPRYISAMDLPERLQQELASRYLLQREGGMATV